MERVNCVKSSGDYKIFTYNKIYFLGSGGTSNFPPTKFGKMQNQIDKISIEFHPRTHTRNGKFASDHWVNLELFTDRPRLFGSRRLKVNPNKIFVFVSGNHFNFELLIPDKYTTDVLLRKTRNMLVFPQIQIQIQFRVLSELL